MIMSIWFVIVLGVVEVMVVTLTMLVVLPQVVRAIMPITRVTQCGCKRWVVLGWMGAYGLIKVIPQNGVFRSGQSCRAEHSCCKHDLVSSSYCRAHISIGASCS